MRIHNMRILLYPRGWLHWLIRLLEVPYAHAPAYCWALVRESGKLKLVFARTTFGLYRAPIGEVWDGQAENHAEILISAYLARK